MATLNLNEEQLLTLKAAWAYFMEDDGGPDAIAEALEISNEDRGYNEDGEETEDYSEDTDPVLKRIGEVGILIMQLE